MSGKLERLSAVQSAKSKDKQQGHLLPRWELQAPNKRYGNGKDKNISEDIEGSIGEPEGQSVHAVALADTPKVLDRNAHQSRTEDSPDAIDGEESKHDLAQLLYPGSAEDTLVLADNGELGEGQTQIVDGDGSPQALQS